MTKNSAILSILTQICFIYIKIKIINNVEFRIINELPIIMLI
mgnify:CR=1 FL=1